VSRQYGRTVLLVSHNIDVVLKLCTKAVLLESGRVRAVGDTKTVTAAYLQSQSSSPRIVDLARKPRSNFAEGKALLTRAVPSDAASNWSFPFGQHLSLDLSVEAQASVSQVDVGLSLFSARGFEVASWTNKCNQATLSVRPGANTFRIAFPGLRLLPGQYSLGIGVGSGRGWDYFVPEAVQFEITSSPEAAEIDAAGLGGVLVPFATVLPLGHASLASSR
jgi:homopolymeric O-antigen transport system ATP-binding protein